MRHERRVNYPALSPHPATHTRSQADRPLPVAPPAARPRRSPWDVPIERLGVIVLNPDGTPVHYCPETQGGGIS